MVSFLPNGASNLAYIPNAQNIPPYDGAGARLTFSIANSTIGVTYRTAVHIQSISTTAPTSPFNWPYAGGFTTQYVTDGGVWSGSETGVIDTSNALLAVMKALYGSQWTLGLSKLERYNSAISRFVRVSPKPSVTPVTGTFASNFAGATDPQLANVSAYTAPSRLAPSDGHLGVGRFRLNLPGAARRDIQAHVEGVTSGTSPGGLVIAADTALIGLLTGSVTRIVAHNGGQPENEFAIHVAPSDRLRRSLGLA